MLLWQHALCIYMQSQLRFFVCIVFWVFFLSHSHFLCYWNNSSWLHFCLCFMLTINFFPAAFAPIVQRGLFFVHLLNATRLRLVRWLHWTSTKKHCGKNSLAWANVNQARASSAFTVYIRCDNGNSCRSTRLHYNLLPRNYKLFVVSDISQFQRPHSYWKRPNWLHCISDAIILKWIFSSCCFVRMLLFFIVVFMISSQCTKFRIISIAEINHCRWTYWTANVWLRTSETERERETSN